MKAKELGDTLNLERYGLFYVGLKDDAFYWEIIVINAKKLVFILCVSLLPASNPEFKVNFFIMKPTYRLSLLY